MVGNLGFGFLSVKVGFGFLGKHLVAIYIVAFCFYFDWPAA
jgi:hypothetical protein